MRKIDREKSANAVRAIHAHLFASDGDVVPAAAELVAVPRKQPNWCAVVDSCISRNGFGRSELVLDGR